MAQQYSWFNWNSEPAIVEGEVWLGDIEEGDVAVQSLVEPPHHSLTAHSLARVEGDGELNGELNSAGVSDWRCSSDFLFTFAASARSTIELSSAPGQPLISTTISVAVQLHSYKDGMQLSFLIDDLVIEDCVTPTPAIKYLFSPIRTVVRRLTNLLPLLNICFRLYVLWYED